MTVDEVEALAAFKHLGLTSYEAQVFIGLHRLGMGTAREVAEVTDVPRSQVYSVADSLADRGLVEVEQANPRRFRPVSVDRARELLEATLERQQDRAFAYVDAVSEESDGHEEQEAIWTIHGSTRITARFVELLEAATDRIIIGLSDPTYLTEEITQSLTEQAAAGVSVYVFTSAPSVESIFESDSHITVEPPENPETDDRASRVLFIDDDGLLLGVEGDDGNETAIWSAGSLLASVVIQLLDPPEGDHDGGAG